MASMFVIFLISASLFFVSSQDICIWGRVGSNTFLNGEYSNVGTWDLAPVYSKTVDSSWAVGSFTGRTYLWKRNTKWVLTDDVPSSSSTIQYRAICDISTQTPQQCGNNWVVASESLADVNMFAQSSPCPFWNCDRVVTTTIGNGCNANFDTVLTTNAWYSSGSNVYWYFVPTSFSWVCRGSYTQNGGVSSLAFTNDLWTDLSKGQSAYLTFEFPDTSSNLINCIQNPTYAPTNDPTYAPTNDPTQNPTKVPTMSPTQIPSFSPTQLPSNYPSQMPTLQPTVTPSDIPTFYPSMVPTKVPTQSPIEVAFENEAQWSNDYLFIEVNFKNNDGVYSGDRVQIRATNLTTTYCGHYFDESTLSIIGMKSSCLWMVNPNIATNGIDMRINLVYPSNISLNSSLNLRFGAFEYRQIDSFDWQILNESLIISEIFAAQNAVKPNIQTSVNEYLGICDSLKLDASATQNLGGRIGDYLWAINDTFYANDNEKEFLWNEIEPNSNFKLSLNVSSWFGTHSFREWQIFKDNKAQPSIRIDGPQYFQLSNDNFDGQIILIAFIEFDDSCLQMNESNGNKQQNIEYSLEWSATCSNAKCEKLSALNSYLRNESASNKDSISFFADLYFEVGGMYTFETAINCLYPFECFSKSFFSISYALSDIKCQISASDMYLYDILLSDFLQYDSLYLDGKSFTFDADNSDALKWTWSCLRTSYAEESVSCNYLLYDSTNSLQSINDSAVYVHFGEDKDWLDYNSQYLYSFSMVVRDETNERICTDSTNLVVGILSKFAQIEWISLNIEIIAAAKVINVAQSLRLIVLYNAINENIDFNDSSINIGFEWIENGNQLTPQMIDALNSNQDKNENGNLIIDGGNLNAGIYQFNVTIFVFINGIKKGQSSASQQIEVQNGALITSFDLSSFCENVTYDSLMDVFFNQYTLQSSAINGQYPLSYAFSYSFEEGIYDFLTSQLQNNGYLDYVLLPIGNFTLNAHVFDATGSASIQSMQCFVQINADWLSECISFNDAILSKYFNESSRRRIAQPFETRKFILFSTAIYINYVFDDLMSGDIDIENVYFTQKEKFQCLRNMVLDTLDAVYDHFNFDNFLFCANDYSVQLALVMTKWANLRSLTLLFDFRASFNGNGQSKYSQKNIFENFDNYNRDLLDMEIFKMSSLIFQILDPCNYILENVQNTNLLSIISLSPLLVKFEKYGFVLHAFADSVFKILAKITKIDATNYYLNIVHKVSNLLTKSLFIAQLSASSLSIAGEHRSLNELHFDIISIRYGATSLNSVNVSNQNFKVEIGDSALSKYLSQCNEDNKQSNALCNGDVIIIGLNRTQSSNNTQFIGSSKKFCQSNDDFGGKLASNEVDINIVGQNVTNLDKNISVIFFVDDDDFDTNDGAVCVWYNEESMQWDDSGCTATSIADNAITCACNHLTTFGTIYALNAFGSCAQSKEFHAVSLIFAILFCLLFAYIVSAIYPFFCHRSCHKMCYLEKAVIVFELIGIICLLQILICVVLFFEDENDSFVYFQIICLLLPLFAYFVLFSLILYSWATVAHSMQMNDEEQIRKRLQYALFCSVGVVCVALIAQIILIPFGIFNNFYFLFFWCSLLAICAIFFGVYGFLMVRLLKITQNKMKNVVKNGENLTNKLLFCAIIICAFFIFELCINLFFALSVIQFSDFWRAFDLALNFLILAVIAFMYDASVKRLRQINGALSRFYDGDSAQKQRKIASKTITKQKSSTKSLRRQHISNVTVTEITEMSNLNGLQNKNTQLIMAYEESSPAPMQNKLNTQISNASITEIEFDESVNNK